MNICIIGSNGQLGKHIFETFKKKSNFFFFSSTLKKKPFLNGNFTKPKDLINKLKKIKPHVIINCSAYTQVDKAEKEKKNAKIINSDGLKILSKYCYRDKIFLIHFSTDYVYSGVGKLPWKESIECKPINYYGFSKLEGEKHIVNSKCKYIIIRLSWLYGKYGNNNFVLKILRNAKLYKELNIVSDQFGSPTNTDLVIKVLKKFLINIKKKQQYSGIFNLCSNGITSRFELSHFILKNYLKKKIYENLIINKIKTKDLKLTARRPLNSRMNINKISNCLNFKIKNWKFYLKIYLLSVIKI